MNILYDLQLSVLTHLRDGKFIFSTDSNVDVASFVLRGLLARHPDWTVYLVLPKSDQFSSDAPIRKQFHGDLPWYQIRLVHVRYFGNPFMERMCFNAASLHQALLQQGNPRIDLVYTNDPCKVLAYKSYFYYREMDKSSGGVSASTVPVICRAHWVTGRVDRKVPEAVDFAVRQFEGAKAAEWTSFNSWFAVSLFLENAREHFHAEAIAAVQPKLEGIETVDVEKMDRYRGEPLLRRGRLAVPPAAVGYPIIVWAHRLSYYTGWEETFNALRVLYATRKDFRVVATDPGNKVTQAALAEQYPFILPIEKPRWTFADYVQLCWDADVVIGNHKHPSIWGGLAITEPMAAYTAPLLPERHSYPEMFYPDARAYFKDEADMLNKLAYLLDNKDEREDLKAKARRFCETNLGMRKFIDRIDDVIHDSVNFCATCGARPGDRHRDDCARYAALVKRSNA